MDLDNLQFENDEERRKYLDRRQYRNLTSDATISKSKA